MTKTKLILAFSFLFLFAGFGGYGSTYAQKSQYEYYRVTQYKVLYGDGKHDDTQALNAWGRGQRVLYNGKFLGKTLHNGKFLITWEVNFKKKGLTVRNNTFIVRYTGYDSVYILHYARGVKHRRNMTMYETSDSYNITYLKSKIEEKEMIIRAYEPLLENQNRVILQLQKQLEEKKKSNFIKLVP